MKKAIIGISSNQESQFDGWFTNHIITYVKSEAIEAVIQAEGLPLVIPVTNEEKLLDYYLENIDGLIITGGHDVYPMLYGEYIQEKCGELYPKTDYYDIYLIRKAIEKKIPTIVICRGMQVANVAFGGTLYQDLQACLHTDIKHHAPQEGNINVHSLKIEDNDSIFSTLTGLKNQIFVNSIHHQGIDKLADIFKIVGKSEDGLIEIIELKSNDQFFVGIQFHPEILAVYDQKAMLNLFRGMIYYIEKGRDLTSD
ncbi:MAG: gamma-glutamyl-gamma-aminobutyrate hydrolase family protein [Bacilli bacterium]|jgi:putative glutamine amidotransferase|nr:gamma-glutamyl-gamma-aminobutyrate hydrolase family protein [Bacilli bacterium]